MLRARVGQIRSGGWQQFLQVEVLVADVRAILPGGRAPAVIDEAVVRDPVQERAELRARLVAAAARDHAAPHFLEDVVRHFRIARVPGEIAIQRAAMAAIKRFERAQISARISKHQLAVIHFGHRVHSTRHRRWPERLRRRQRLRRKLRASALTPEIITALTQVDLPWVSLNEAQGLAGQRPRALTSALRSITYRQADFLLSTCNC